MKCCKELNVHTRYTADHADALNWLLTRGHKLRFDVDDYVIMNIKLPCAKLTEEGCSCYSTRPNTCRQFDGRKYLGDECLWSTLKD